MVESSILNKESIIQSIEFPAVKDAFKVLKTMKEISLSLMKKVETSIHKSKLQRRRLSNIYLKKRRNFYNQESLYSSQGQRHIRTGKLFLLSFFSSKIIHFDFVIKIMISVSVGIISSLKI